MCGGDAAWFATAAGGAKQHGERNRSAGKLKLHIEDPGNPILAGMPDFEMDDDMSFLLRMAPEAHVLATTPDPAGKIVPQLWVNLVLEDQLAGRAHVRVDRPDASNPQAPNAGLARTFCPTRS